ncbi:excinuclease ABC subunit UvrA [Actinocrispum wychmicini]|uniref:UvrABC system protein A n=1 Tax=Actinocrispum wychmicini TaxID=1213861 RepID=A0A4R2JP47_9PSEU|nr:excinuclease ABC subunit UvrA [Actinocrispum wychmicini]TCO61921.1 excinuclease ABC subunit A [Actinocrispum wychmicini]
MNRLAAERGQGIVVREARENNLRSVTVEIPRHAITVITGPSGSGKSSLAFDTIFAEGQRQYLESLSPFQRRGFDQLPRPKVTTITGLGPTIAVRQHVPGRNPRSTVGSITEIGNLVRLLFSRAGVHTCLGCSALVAPRSPDALIAEGVAAVGDRPAVFSLVRRSALSTGAQPDLPRRVVARRSGGADEDLAAQLRRCVLQATRTPDAVLLVEPDGAPPRYLDTEWTCGACGHLAIATSSQFFSPNSPEGMCPDCEGLGVRYGVSADLLVADEDASVRAGALTFYGDRRLDRKKTYWPLQDLPQLVDVFGASLDTAWLSLTPALRDVILHGGTERPVSAEVTAFLGKRTSSGLIPEIERLFRAAKTLERKEFYQRFMKSAPCAGCEGRRLAPGALAVRLAGDDIVRTMGRPVRDLPAWLDQVRATDMPAVVAAAVTEIDKELRRKIVHVEQVGLGYLALDRPVPTLSAGEGQRLRIARQLGSTLVDVVYVLDEPSVGLHPADTGRLADSLRQLRDAGNTVILVEHDPDLMRAADHIIDIGPRAGEFGGQVVAIGPPAVLAAESDSPTAKYLRGELVIGATKRRPRDPAAELRLTGARLHNLRDVTVAVPHGLMTCVTGPSGSGKSSLVTDLLQRAVSAAADTGRVPRGPFTDLSGHQGFTRVVSASQDPMGRNSRSIPATYIGIFDEIRRLFARLPLSVRHRWSTAHFSFNAEAGQCLTCRGSGEQAMELHFLPDVRVPCPACHGRRFNEDVLAARWREHTIAEVLDLDVSTAAELFSDQPKIADVLRVLVDVGLGYLRLGQGAVTLSGGEAQRLKLARELCRDGRDGPCLYILDEPTSGLHAVDVALLVGFLRRFVDTGHTMIVIEHNVDVIAAADWVIDLGPGSGADGGRVVAVGTPEDIARHEHSAMAPFLRRTLAGRGLGAPDPTTEPDARRSDAPGEFARP